MNVFVVGIPLRVFLGLIVLMAMLPFFASLSSRLFAIMFEYIEQMLGVMMP
jgi:flagellar biosynthetic protein FliR